jgi:hypothetical protein
MIWKKKGLISNPLKKYSWAMNGSLQPTSLLLENSIRVFCGFRDIQGISRIGYIDLDLDNPSRVIDYSKEPILDIGKPGTFDESGVVPSALYFDGDTLFLYYAGYQLGTKVRFSVLGGLAISKDVGKSFERFSNTPLFERTNEELLFRVPHSIIKAESGFKIWYGGGSNFIKGKNKILPSYNIRYLETDDLTKIPEKGKTFLDINGKEYRLGRPNVFVEDGSYKMFYGYSTEEILYKLGYAESNDLSNSWVRKDNELNLPLSKEGWDSEMMAYPSYVKTSTNNRILFYNGNNYGREGFGYALLKSW